MDYNILKHRLIQLMIEIMPRQITRNEIADMIILIIEDMVDNDDFQHRREHGRD